MTKKHLTIVQLYPADMSIYGDWGNTLTLKKRLEWHGYDATIVDYNVGDVFPKQADILIGGGGQDSGQKRIQQDLQHIAPTLTKLVEHGTPALVVCGLYQLFGRFFKTADGDTIPGIGIFDTETHAGPERLTGNVIATSEYFGEIIGYENHSGQTFLGPKASPLGMVTLGAGNNGQDETEGAVVHNVIGTYLHGALLPKNPTIADFLIEKAAINAFGEFEPAIIDDRLAHKAREIAKKRPR